MSIEYVSLSPVLTYCPKHVHDFWEIVLTLKGEGYVLIGNEKYLFKPGTIICQPPNMPQVIYSNAEYQDIYVRFFEFHLSDKSKPNNVIIFQDDSEKSFEMLIRMANRIFHKKEKNYQNILKSIYDVMENLLLGWYEYTPNNIEIEKIKNKIVNSFTDPQFSIEKILLENTYCKDHLRRLFKKETGFTFIEYLTNLRINHAKSIMNKNKISNFSISEIAVMSGFYDTGYFSQVFKKNFNISPSEYLKKINF